MAKTLNTITPSDGYNNQQVAALGYQPGYSGTENSWTQVTCNLSSYNGQTVIFRWLFCSDNMIVGTGWFIDDVSLTGLGISTKAVEGNITLVGGNGTYTNALISNGTDACYADSVGSYNLYLTPGNYNLKASLADYTPAETAVTVNNTGLSNIDFALSYLPSPQQLIGSIENNVAQLHWLYSTRDVLSANKKETNNRAVFTQFKIYCQTNVSTYQLVDSTTATNYNYTLTTGNTYHFYVVACYSSPTATSSPSNVIGLAPGSGPGWVPIEYNNITTIPCIITLNDQPASDVDILGAFINNECRGVSSINNQSTANILIYAGEPDTVRFMLYKATTQQYFTCNTTVIATPGVIVTQPLTLNFTPVGTEDPAEIPTVSSINMIYPNPFNPETNIRFSIAEKTKATIKVYNIKGQLVKALVNEVMNPGKYSVVWKGTNDLNHSCSSGVYFVRFSAGKSTNTQKILLLK